MTTWCPIYPSMFFGSYTIYYAMEKNETTGICGPNSGSLSGPNGLSCGCNAGGCISGLRLLSDFGRGLGMKMPRIDDGDCWTFDDGLRKSAFAGQLEHQFHGRIKRFGLASPPGKHWNFAPGVYSVDIDETTVTETPITIVFERAAGGPRYKALIFLLKFKTDEFELDSPPALDDKLAVVGVVIDKASGDQVTPNVTVDSTSGKYAVTIKFKDNNQKEREAYLSVFRS